MMVLMRICLLLSVSAAAPINSNPDKKAAEEHFVSDDIVTADDGLHNHSSENTGREERLVITGGNVHIESIGNITIMNTNFHNNHPGLSDSKTTQSAPSDSQNPESASDPGISETTQSAPGISQNHESASDPVERNGEEVCEGQNYDEATCNAIQCCIFEDGQCWSKQPCGPPGQVLPGGFSDLEVNDAKAISAAFDAVSILAEVPGGSNPVSPCGENIELVGVEKASSQDEEGTKYKLTLRLATHSGDDCATKVEKVCEDISVWEKLPHMCPGDKACHQLIQMENIKCGEAVIVCLHNAIFHGDTCLCQSTNSADEKECSKHQACMVDGSCIEACSDGDEKQKSDCICKNLWTERNVCRKGQICDYKSGICLTDSDLCKFVDCALPDAIKFCPITCDQSPPDLCSIIDCDMEGSKEVCPRACLKDCPVEVPLEEDCLCNGDEPCRKDDQCQKEGGCKTCVDDDKGEKCQHDIFPMFFLLG